MTAQTLNIGFAPLTDCASLVVARERGIFAQNGLDVSLRRFVSWAAMRDALGSGVIDAAHMLSPMVVASAARLGPFPGDFTTAFTMNLNGNAITVSNALHEEMQQRAPDLMEELPLTARALKRVIEQRQAEGGAPLTLAHVYPQSMHSYELRFWLAEAGIDPDRDLNLVVVPPSLTVDALSTGHIDGYCVGEPWNSAAVVGGLGRTLITSGEIWSNGPEKVLAVRKSWASDHHDTHLALIASLSEASKWLDDVANRQTAARMIAAPEYVNTAYDEIVSSLTGVGVQTGGHLRLKMPDFNVFHRYAANFPWRSHAKWILSQMVRWGEVPETVDVESVAENAFRPDIYCEAVKALDVACPVSDQKVEGAHQHAWLMETQSQPIACSADRFLDGKPFDPARFSDYVSGFDIRRGEDRLGESDRSQVADLGK